MEGAPRRSVRAEISSSGGGTPPKTDTPFEESLCGLKPVILWSEAPLVCSIAGSIVTVSPLSGISKTTAETLVPIVKVSILLYHRKTIMCL